LIVAGPAAVALVLLGPIGGLVDRVGARRVLMGALASAASGLLVLSTAETAKVALFARVLTGIGAAAFWPTNQALVASIVPTEGGQRYFGGSFALLNAGIGVGGVIGGMVGDVAQPRRFGAC